MTKFLHVIDLIVYYLLAVFLAALVIILFNNIVFRFILHLPIHWTEEISMLLFIWIVFLGAAVVQKRQGHVSIQIVYDHCPGFIRNIMTIMGQVFVLIISAILVMASVKLVRVQSHSLTPGIMMPFSFFSVSVLISSILMLLYTALSFVDNVRAVKGERLARKNVEAPKERISS